MAANINPTLQTNQIMKKVNYEFKVQFKNGKKEVFYCGDILNAFCNATIYATNKGWDNSIDHIFDTDSSRMYMDFNLSFKDHLLHQPN